MDFYKNVLVLYCNCFDAAAITYYCCCFFLKCSKRAVKNVNHQDICNNAQICFPG